MKALVLVGLAAVGFLGASYVSEAKEVARLRQKADDKVMVSCLSNGNTVTMCKAATRLMNGELTKEQLLQYKAQGLL